MSISTPTESNMDKIRVLDPILEAGLPTIKLAIEIRTKANPKAPYCFWEAMGLASMLKLSAVNLRTESPPGKKVPTGFHREFLRVQGPSIDPRHASDSLYCKYEEFNAMGLRIALMESSQIDHWNAIVGLVLRFGRLTLAGEINLTPGLTHRDALTSGKADPSQIRNIETSWFGGDKAHLYRILKDKGKLGVFYEVICVDDPKRIIFYDIARDITESHADPLRGIYTDNVP